MPKRKREEVDLEPNHAEDDRALRIRKSRLVAQIDQGNILLHRALKFARGFERQKLGRRQKAARENPQALLRLTEEVAVLKRLDLAKTAENHLFKQLVRTKRIREAPASVALHGEEAESKLKAIRAGAEANVVGRLMNSNPVREVLPQIMGKVYRCLGLEEVPVTAKAQTESEEASPPGRSKVRRAGSEKDGNGMNSDWEGLSPNRVDHHSGVSAVKSSDGSTALSDDSVVASLDFQVSNSDTDMAQYGHRLASSPSASGPSSDDEEDETFRSRMFDLDPTLRPREAASISPSISRSPSPSHSKATTLPHPKPPLPAPAAPRPQARTTFLPSLILGGYFSGSDSDSKSNSSSNSDVNQFRKRNPHAPALLAQPRKNRRGQRARQQIAEKKYGGSAKHLQKQQQQQQQTQIKPGRMAGPRHRDDDAGWDPRKGATASKVASNGPRKRGTARREARRPAPRTRGPQSSGANSEAITATRRRDRDHGVSRADAKAKPKVKPKADPEREPGPIHPSWEAARKRKAQSQRAMALFSGTKITF